MQLKFAEKSGNGNLIGALSWYGNLDNYSQVFLWQYHLQQYSIGYNNEDISHSQVLHRPYGKTNWL